jgi:hypothetical protein
VKKFSIFLLLLVVSLQDAVSQCAMCKAQLETNEGEIGNGINEGILFLMIIPYVLLTLLLFVFFRGRIKSIIGKILNMPQS